MSQAASHGVPKTLNTTANRIASNAIKNVGVRILPLNEIMLDVQFTLIFLCTFE